MATKKLLKAPDDSMLLYDKASGSAAPLATVSSMFVLLTVAIRVPEQQACGVEVTAALFSEPSCDARLWISIPSVYDHLGLDMFLGTASGWLAKRKSSFVRLCNSLQLGMLAIREALPWERDAASTDDGKCLTWPGFSCHAMIAVLGTAAWRSSKSEGAVANPTDKMKIKHFLASFVLRTPKAWTLQFCLDKEVLWIPGKGIAGRHLVTINVQNSILDLRMSCHLASQVFGARSGVLALCEGSDQVSLCALMKQACAMQGTIGQWLFAQLVWQVGSMIDRYLSGRFESASRCDGGFDDDSIYVQASTVMGDGQDFRYHKKGLEVFKDCQYISMAPDASKIGDKGLLLSPIVKNGSGEAMWAAPQAMIVFGQQRV